MSTSLQLISDILLSYKYSRPKGSNSKYTWEEVITEKIEKLAKEYPQYSDIIKSHKSKLVDKLILLKEDTVVINVSEVKESEDFINLCSVAALFGVLQGLLGEKPYLCSIAITGVCTGKMLELMSRYSNLLNSGRDAAEYTVGVLKGELGEEIMLCCGIADESFELGVSSGISSWLSPKGSISFKTLKDTYTHSLVEKYEGKIDIEEGEITMVSLNFTIPKFSLSKDKEVEGEFENRKKLFELQWTKFPIDSNNKFSTLSVYYE